MITTMKDKEPVLVPSHVARVGVEEVYRDVGASHHAFIIIFLIRASP